MDGEKAIELHMTIDSPNESSLKFFIAQIAHN